jgi:hypothetical protein
MLQVLLDTGDALGKLVDGDDSSDSVDSSDDVVLNGVVVVVVHVGFCELREVHRILLSRGLTIRRVNYAKLREGVEAQRLTPNPLSVQEDSPPEAAANPVEPITDTLEDIVEEFHYAEPLSPFSSSSYTCCLGYVPMLLRTV